MKGSLPLFDRPGAVPGRDEERRPRLLRFMAGRGKCQKAELADYLAVGDRVLRDLVASSDGEIIAVSSESGYILIDEATTEEIRHAAAELRSRARHLLTRAMSIERRAHHRLHVPGDVLGGAA